LNEDDQVEVDNKLEKTTQGHRPLKQTTKTAAELVYDCSVYHHSLVRRNHLTIVRYKLKYKLQFTQTMTNSNINYVNFKYNYDKSKYNYSPFKNK